MRSFFARFPVYTHDFLYAILSQSRVTHLTSSFNSTLRSLKRSDNALKLSQDSFVHEAPFRYHSEFFVQGAWIVKENRTKLVSLIIIICRMPRFDNNDNSSFVITIFNLRSYKVIVSYRSAVVSYCRRHVTRNLWNRTHNARVHNQVLRRTLHLRVASRPLRNLWFYLAAHSRINDKVVKSTTTLQFVANRLGK